MPAGLQRGGSSAAVKQMLPQTRTWEGKVDGQEGVVCRMGEMTRQREGAREKERINKETSWSIL